MYKICTRCHFRVAIRYSACQVCGYNKFDGSSETSALLDSNPGQIRIPFPTMADVATVKNFFSGLIIALEEDLEAARTTIGNGARKVVALMLVRPDADIDTGKTDCDVQSSPGACIYSHKELSNINVEESHGENAVLITECDLKDRRNIYRQNAAARKRELNQLRNWFQTVDGENQERRSA